jgi:peptide-methionine (S)-S-oxide reductase
MPLAVTVALSGEDHSIVWKRHESVTVPPAPYSGRMSLFGRNKTRSVTAGEALPGRTEPLAVPERHAVYPDRRIKPPFREGLRTAVFGLGCFWGAERLFWQTPGVYSTAVGYAGGHTPNPTYEEVCSGLTGHTEAVLVVYDPTRVSYETLLKVFWEGHDPTQGMRQGNDIGTQYRSAVYYADDQRADAEASRDAFQAALAAAGRGEITTELAPAGEFYYAEDYHQQYLNKVPNGYCGLGGTGVTCPTGLNT